MIKTPLITICIPTYNREKFLPETLNSIIEQDGFNEEDIEIVISDNASIDSTSIIVKGYQEKYKNIKYFKNDENIGSDRNIIKIMQLWTGQYIWWITDDDIMLPGGLQIVKKNITENLGKDICFFQTNFSICNADMKTIFQGSYIGEWLETKIYNNIHDLYDSYSYRHGWIAFFSVGIFSSKIRDLPISKIPVTHFPHSCIAWLISDKKSMFIGYDTIWFRQNNSSHENIGTFSVFFQLFVIDHMKYMKFLRQNKSVISQKELTFILFKMIILSILRACQSWIGISHDIFKKSN
jgi:glycosyltransferase involved in cell wall biosynthesis